MKKKTVVLKKLSLDKMPLAALNGAEQILGGATIVLNTASPCNPCDLSRETNCVACEPLTKGIGCVVTGGMKTVCDIC